MDLTWVNTSKCYSQIGDEPSLYSFLHHNNNNLDNDIHFYRSRSQMSTIPVWAQMPDHNTTQNTFQEIMDSRALEIIALSAQYNKTFISWSGGIDSTAVIAALLKHAPQDFLNNVQVLLGQESVWENPYFYRDHIRPRFPNLVNIKEFNKEDHANDLVITGDLGDRIFGSNLGVNWYLKNPGHGRGPYQKDTDRLIDYFYSRVKSATIAVRIFELMDSAAKSSGLDIVTTYDLLWWFSFDFTWIEMRLEKFIKFQNHSRESLEAYLKNYISWYTHRDFQIWSMQNLNSVLKFDAEHFQHKRALREYIHELDHNDWYYKFKNKTRSLENIPKLRNSPTWLLAIDNQNNVYHTTDTSCIRDYRSLSVST